MYTGIVQAVLCVESVERRHDFMRIKVRFPAPLLEGVNLGASIGFNGVCLTVAAIEEHLLSFDIMRETLAVTNLGAIEVGSYLNVERSAKWGDEVGGHLLSGHVMGVAEILNLDKTDDNLSMRMKAPEKCAKYLFSKGYVGLNGASLTLAQVQGSEFSVHLIPETLRLTTFLDSQVGDKVNLEVDSQTQVIVETVERVLSERAH
jgi:riboflavin synthase